MVRTAINVYSVRELDDSVPELVERVADAGYDGIQFSGNHTPLAGDPEEIAATLDETGLAVTPAHIEIDDLEERREAVCAAYETLGVNEAVVPYLDASAFESSDALDRTIQRLTALHTALNDEGWGVHYHNHDHEFAEIEGGDTGFEAIIERMNVGFELDVGWARYAGWEPAALIETYGDRMPLIHMKDVAVDADWEECFREIGTGDVDMQACADAARDAGAEWLIYEHDAPENPVESIERGAEFLNSL